MTTVQAFNSLLKNFIDELAETFPEESKITFASKSFDTLVKNNPRMPLDMFVNALSPHTTLLMAKDPKLFDQPIELGGMDLAKVWAKDDVSQASREAIWSYLHTLFVLGTTVSTLPAQFLTTIEALAHDAAGAMEAGGKPDFSAVATQLMGLGGLESIIGALGNGLPNLGPSPKDERKSLR
jgi:hypothetical protein